MSINEKTWNMADRQLQRRHEDGVRIANNLVSIADASRRSTGEDIPLGTQLREAAGIIATLIESLQECEEYFDNRADADCDQDGFIPNEEMKLLAVVRDALRKAGVA